MASKHNSLKEGGLANKSHWKREGQQREVIGRGRVSKQKSLGEGGSANRSHWQRED